MTQSIALCMIVRDESAVIERCIGSVRGLIDRWVICDTGSVDDTPERIEAALAGVPGELHRSEWRDFGTNRSELMTLARGAADYLLLLDADMTLRVEGTLPSLTADAYLVRHDGPLGYLIPRLVGGDREWRFVGVTHEYLSTDGPHSEEILEALVVEHHGDGGHRAEKLTRDRDLLEAALRRDPDDARAVFYLAQTYRDLGEEERAIELYSRRGELGGWYEEAAYALYQAGVLLAGRDTQAGLALLLRAWQQAPSRAEPLHELARIARFRGWHDVALMFAARGLEIPYPAAGLFVHDWIYAWGMLYEFALAALAAGNVDDARLAADEVLEERWLPADVRTFLTERFAPRKRSSQALGELLPKVEYAEVRLDVSPAWSQFNPTIAESDNGYVMIVRTANYRLRDGVYEFFDQGDTTIRTLNYVVSLDRDLNVTDVSPLGDRSDGPPRYPSSVVGFEDCRLVRAGERWFATATVRDRNPEGWCEVALLELDGPEIATTTVLPGPATERHEKNWMPFVSDGMLRFVYSCAPTIVLGYDPVGGVLEQLSSSHAPAPAAPLRGGSQGVAVDGGTLFVVHEADGDGAARSYRHRFLLLGDDHRLIAASRSFRFMSSEIEFCAGLAHRGSELLLTLGVGDHTAMLAVIDRGSALALLEPWA